jgi:hypothetical protein
MSDLEAELRQAQADLRRASQEFRQRLESCEFRLEDRIRHRPLTAAVVAAGLGFTIGRASQQTALLVAMLGGVVAGFALANSRKEFTNRNSRS